MLVVDALGDGVTRLSVSQSRPPSSSLFFMAAVAAAVAAAAAASGMATLAAAAAAAAAYRRNTATGITESITIIPNAGFVLTVASDPSASDSEERFIALGDVEHAALFETFSRCTIRMTLALVPKNSARPLIVLFSHTRPPTATLVACLAQLQQSFQKSVKTM